MTATHATRILAALALAAALGACAAEEGPSLFDEEVTETADVGTDGAFAFSLADYDSVVGLSEQVCEPGELCNLNLEFGLGDWDDYDFEPSELERYGIELEGMYEGYDGTQIEVRETWSLPSILDGGLGSVRRDTGSSSGGGWRFKFRPTGINPLKGDFIPDGFYIQGRIDLCGGLPCR